VYEAGLVWLAAHPLILGIESCERKAGFLPPSDIQQKLTRYPSILSLCWLRASCECFAWISTAFCAPQYFK
jgi:hypothetical protein